MERGIILVIVVLVVIALWLTAIYNRLVAMREQVRASWAQIDTLLKRRYDLIPNLVETVKGYASHERQTLESVISARNQAVSASTPEQKVQAEGQLTGALRQLFAVAEAYPDLKANANFRELQQELSRTEDDIGEFRQHYNATATVYNTAAMSFPTNLVAGLFGFKPQQLYELQDTAQREAPQVKF